MRQRCGILQRQTGEVCRPSRSSTKTVLARCKWGVPTDVAAQLLDGLPDHFEVHKKPVAASHDDFGAQKRSEAARMPSIVMTERHPVHSGMMPHQYQDCQRDLRLASIPIGRPSRLPSSFSIRYSPAGINALIPPEPTRSALR